MMRKVVLYGLASVGALAIVGLLFLGVVMGATMMRPASANALAGNTRGYAARDEAFEAMPPPAPPAAEAPAPGGGGRGIGHGGPMAAKKSAMAHRSDDGLLAADKAPDPEMKEEAEQQAQKPKSGEGGGNGAAAPTREWFPESFLFQPLIVTGPDGTASIPARVPDRLTSWRVLALAHSRSGLQAGNVTSFLGTLPAYVEPVVPPFLVASDQVRLPIQVVNTTPSPLSEALQLEASGAQLASVGGRIDVPAGGNKVQYVGLQTARPGDVKLKATLGSTDAVLRTFNVRPNGKPVDQSFGGTLAAPRTLTISGPANALPDSARVRLAVFPGALSLLRAELTGASSRSGPEADAYALLLSGKGPQLLQQLGEKADADAIRSMTLVSAQRALQWSRTPDLPTAVLFAEAALAHPENPVLDRLGSRLADQVARAQRPDGTFSGADGWTVQRLLVATADGLRAVRAGATDDAGKRRAEAARVRAEGAFERNIKLVQDGYTAAVILSSGGVSGTLADELRERVRGAVKSDQEGSRYLRVESDTVRADGATPSAEEATALAALALEGDPKATWRADLGSFILSHYRPESGWGDGETNQACLTAVLALFKDPLPAKIDVTLEEDGKPVTSGTLTGARLKEVLGLETAVASAAGSHTWTVKADPPVLGLGYAMSLRVYVPWEKSENDSGFELTLATPKHMRVGQPANVEMKAVAPSGTAARIREALPAGVQADRASLERLKSDGTIFDYVIEDGAVSLGIPAKEEGEVFEARYRVIPTFAGTLHAAASTIAPEGRPELAYELPPVVWTVE